MNKGSRTIVEHHVVRYADPVRTFRTVTDCITFRDGVLDKRHSIPSIPSTEGRMCLFNLEPDQEALVHKVSLLYAQSDYAQSTVFQTKPLFDVEAGQKKHPDSRGGAFTITIPGDHWGPIAKHDSILYEPQLVNLRGGGVPILQYAGMESRIMGASSTAIWDFAPATGEDQFELFAPNDPLLTFLMQHKNLFDELNAGDLRKRGDYYLVRTSLSKRVRQFFENQVFPRLHYTKEPYITFTHQLEELEQEGTLLFQVQTEFLVIESPCMDVFKAQNHLLCLCKNGRGQCCR